MNFLSFKGNIILPEKTMFLQDMFGLQKTLLESYVEISGLPNFPCSLQTKQNQKMIKEFLAYVSEELSEAFEHLEEIMDLLNSPKSNTLSKFLSIKHLEVNEELADCWHFLLEVLIYCNVTPESISSFLLSEFQKLNIGDKFIIQNSEEGKIDILEAALFYSSIRNSERFNKPSKLDQYTQTRVDNVYGAYLLSPIILRDVGRLNWDIIHTSNITRGLLKNKAWKQTPVEANTKKFQEGLLLIFIKLCDLMEFLDFDSTGIYYTYHRKNLINQERIKTKY